MDTKKLVGILGILLGVAYYQYTYKSVSELVKGLDQQNRLLHIAICTVLIACGAIIFGIYFANVVPKIEIEPVKRKSKGATKVLKQRVIQK